MTLKVNPGTQIRVSPSLSRDMEHTHSIIDPLAQIGINKFSEISIFWNFKTFTKIEILKLLKYSIAYCESNDM